MSAIDPIPSFAAISAVMFGMCAGSRYTGREDDGGWPWSFHGLSAQLWIGFELNI